MHTEAQLVVLLAGLVVMLAAERRRTAGTGQPDPASTDRQAPPGGRKWAG